MESKILNCHKCPYNGKGDNHCLSCNKQEQTLKYQKYIFDGYDAPATENTGSEKATSLPDDIEDKVRKFLYDIFDLPYNELMILKAIFNKKSLTEFAKDMQKLSEKNQGFSRFRAFQTRLQLIDKMGDDFKSAFETTGQRKELKSKK